MVQTTKFQLSGLTCDACEKVISKRLKTIDGVTEVHVTVKSGLASVIASRLILKDEVLQALKGTNYKIINNN